MARQKVEQVQCDRCKRVELQPVREEKSGADLVVNFDGKTLEYYDLCSTCRSAITRLIKEMKEWDRTLTQKLLGPALEGEKAPPTFTPPDYSPPKPHK